MSSAFQFFDVLFATNTEQKCKLVQKIVSNYTKSPCCQSASWDMQCHSCIQKVLGFFFLFIFKKYTFKAGMKTI